MSTTRCQLRHNRHLRHQANFVIIQFVSLQIAICRPSGEGEQGAVAVFSKMVGGVANHQCRLSRQSWSETTDRHRVACTPHHVEPDPMRYMRIGHHQLRQRNCCCTIYPERFRIYCDWNVNNSKLTWKMNFSSPQSQLKLVAQLQALLHTIKNSTRTSIRAPIRGR